MYRIYTYECNNLQLPILKLWVFLFPQVENEVEVAFIQTKSGKILIAEEIDVKLLEEKNAKWHKACENQVDIKKSRKSLGQKKQEQ